MELIGRDETVHRNLDYIAVIFTTLELMTISSLHILLAVANHTTLYGKIPCVVVPHIVAEAFALHLTAMFKFDFQRPRLRPSNLVLICFTMP